MKRKEKFDPWYEPTGLEAVEVDTPNVAPEGDGDRKKLPIATGVVDYFPDALMYLAKISWDGNEKHNPGQALHWSRNQSSDHADCAMRHFVDRGKKDAKGTRHTGNFAWRALAMLQIEIEEARAKGEDV